MIKKSDKLQFFLDLGDKSLNNVVNNSDDTLTQREISVDSNKFLTYPKVSRINNNSQSNSR